MIRVLRVLVPEVIIAPLWASYVARANALVAVGWRSDAVGPLACMGVIAPVTLPVWVFLSFTDDSVRWAYSGGRAWAIAGYGAAAVLVGVRRNWRGWRRARLIGRGRCAECGYDLRGNRSVPSVGCRWKLGRWCAGWIENPNSIRFRFDWD